MTTIHTPRPRRRVASGSAEITLQIVRRRRRWALEIRLARDGQPTSAVDLTVGPTVLATRALSDLLEQLRELEAAPPPEGEPAPAEPGEVVFSRAGRGRVSP